MSDTTVKKVCARYSPQGAMGQRYLASGVSLSMRLWESEPTGQFDTRRQRQYETVGFVLHGRAELQLEGQMVLLEPGDSWVVPKGASHCYNVLERFTAVEATAPPAQVHGRDETEA